jgi:hypothetical protein
MQISLIVFEDFIEVLCKSFAPFNIFLWNLSVIVFEFHSLEFVSRPECHNPTIDWTVGSEYLESESAPLTCYSCNAVITDAGDKICFMW